MLEAVLASVHYVAIFTLIVFQVSQAALCRAAWLNAAVLERLLRLRTLSYAAFALVLASGLARLWWGIKGAENYMASPWMHVKLTLFACMFALALPAHRAYTRWALRYRAGAQLPNEGDIVRARTWLMASSHLMLLLPICAVWAARGW